jgi:Uma2 family endonuclease
MKAVVPKRMRWTVKDYFRLSRMGFFNGRRVELLEGDIVEMPAQGHAHNLAVTRISRLFLQAFGTSHWVAIQGTWKLSTVSAPDPDFHVYEAPEGTPENQLRVPILVVEVSDTTYRKDSGAKLRMYARAGVEDYWIVNLALLRLEVYRRPENPTGKRADWRYASVSFHGRGEEVRPLRRQQVAFAVDAMLP